MAKERERIDLGLTGYDELFMTDTERKESRLPHIHDILLSEIDPFPEHPYKVKDDDGMITLVESIKERGVITPAIVRKKEDGRYELISGHRRERACEIAGLETLRCDVVDITHDEAVIMMVDANCQRTKILPSEKAFAYKMKLDAKKRQGQRTDLSSGQLVPKSDDNRTTAIIGVAQNESYKTVQRYIRLTCLEKPLLDLVDSGKIAFSPAVELSYLTSEEQDVLINVIESEDCTPSLSQACRMKIQSEEGTLDPYSILEIMTEFKGNQKEKIKIPIDSVRKFFPQSYSVTEMEKAILKLCQDSFERKKRQERDLR